MLELFNWQKDLYPRCDDFCSWFFFQSCITIYIKANRKFLLAVKLHLFSCLVDLLKTLPKTVQKISILYMWWFGTILKTCSDLGFEIGIAVNVIFPWVEEKKKRNENKGEQQLIFHAVIIMRATKLKLKYCTLKHNLIFCPFF